MADALVLAVAARADASARAPGLGIAVPAPAAAASAAGPSPAWALGVPGAAAEAAASAPVPGLSLGVAIAAPVAAALGSAVAPGTDLPAEVAEAAAAAWAPTLVYDVLLAVSGAATATAAAPDGRVRARWTVHVPRGDRTLTLVTADGARYPLNGPLYVLEIDGLGFPEEAVRLSATPFQTGATFERATYRPRELNLAVWLKADAPRDLLAARQHIAQAVNPARGPLELVLAYERGTETYTLRQVTLDGELDLGYSAREARRTQRASCRLVAHDPAWYGAERSARFTPALGAPQLTFPASFPIVFGATPYALDETRAVAIDGHWPAAPQVVCVGPMALPRVENTTTGKVLQLNTIIPPGTTVTIDTATGAVTDQAGASWRGYLAPAANLATFALLAPGEEGVVNVLRVTASHCTAGTTIDLVWRNRYLMTP